MKDEPRSPTLGTSIILTELSAEADASKVALRLNRKVVTGKSYA